MPVKKSHKTLEFLSLRSLLVKKKFVVHGKQGGISLSWTLPKGFDIKSDHCHIAILMHGFMANKNMNPINALAKSFAKEGIGAIRFDFNAHGKSEGKFEDMTISNEIADAMAIFDYVNKLDFVDSVSFVGHSQGGVIASMLAGRLNNYENRPVCVTLLAPAAVLKDDAIEGKCMGTRYDASNPPPYVNVMMHKLGRSFIKEAQTLPIYEESFKYTGPVCIIHGIDDRIVPVKYSEFYHSGYKQSTFHKIEDEGHFMRKNLNDIVRITIAFTKSNILNRNAPR